MSNEREIAYRNMLNMEAWREIAALLDRLVTDSDKMVDEVDISVLTVADVAQARGIRYAVGKIRKHIEDALNGGPK